MGSYSDVGFNRFVEGRQGPTHELWCEEEAAEGERVSTGRTRSRRGRRRAPTLFPRWVEYGLAFARNVAACLLQQRVTIRPEELSALG